MKLFHYCSCLILAVLVTGCGTVNYAPFVGQQKAWPVREGAFVEKSAGLYFYQSWPERPYEILGHLTVSAKPLYLQGQLKSAIRKHHADGIILVSQETFQAGSVANSFGGGSANSTVAGNQIHTAGYGGGTTINTPIYQSQASGYLFRFLTNHPNVWTNSFAP